MKCFLPLLVGLSLRLSVNGADEPAKPVAGLAVFASGFTSPLNLVSLPNGEIWVADQVGPVHRFSKSGESRGMAGDFAAKLVTLQKGFDERGVLGVALHPRFRDNRKFYVFYSAPLRKEGPTGWNCTSTVSEFKTGADGKIDLNSERVLLQIDKPDFNHNCGRIAFGPDGYLYIGVGDGGNANDSGRGHTSPQGNGQDTSVLLGKILRIDVDHGTPYAIPSDNPFAKGGGKPEIFAFGVRNPWGISFDRGGRHELFAADVGQDRFEEINIIVKGGNYGWRTKEGHDYFNLPKPTQAAAEGPAAGPDGKPFIDPIIAYKNFKGFPKITEAQGISVTGGYVYRGKAIPGLQGKYVFADWSRNWGIPDGVLFVATRSGDKWSMQPMELATGKVGGYIVALGEDSDGELYVMTNGSNMVVGNSGKVLKLIPPKN